MYEIRDIRPSHLLLDSKNPRLERIEDRQLEALHGLWRDATKMLGLARHISANGLDPTVRMAAIRAEGGSHDYVVLEGNRRLAALLALADPGRVADILKPAQKAGLDAYSAAYLRTPAATVPCAVFPSREEAQLWIELRHSPDPTGAGVLMWGAEEKSRFKSRGGTLELPVQIVDIVKTEGQLTPADAKAVQQRRFITTLRRLTNDPEVRKRLNISTDSAGVIKFDSPRRKTVKALSKIVRDFATGTATVKDVYHKSDRREYLERLEASGTLPPVAAPAPAVAKSPGLPVSGKGRVVGLHRDREKLFRPMTVNFSGAPRIGRIFSELRGMKLTQYPNAVAVLFRVFLELSVDHYLVKRGVMTSSVLNKTRRLRTKVQAVLDHMKVNGILDAQQLKPVLRAMQKSKGIVGPAHLESLQAYVHNPHFSPRPEELKPAADDWQTFLEKIWP